MSLQACLSRSTFTLQLEILKNSIYVGSQEPQVEVRTLSTTYKVSQTSVRGEPLRLHEPPNPNNVHLGAWRGWASPHLGPGPHGETCPSGVNLLPSVSGRKPALGPSAPAPGLEPPFTCRLLTQMRSEGPPVNPHTFPV